MPPAAVWISGLPAASTCASTRLLEFIDELGGMLAERLARFRPRTATAAWSVPAIAT